MCTGPLKVHDDQIVTHIQRYFEVQIKFLLVPKCHLGHTLLLSKLFGPVQTRSLNNDKKNKKAAVAVVQYEKGWR